MAVVGYRYYFDMLFGIGLSADELVEIKVGEKTAWRGSVTDNTQISIDQPNLFGGDKLEGGVAGALDVLFGGSTQVATSGITSSFGSPQPGRRGRFTAFYSGQVCANSPYPKRWAFRTRRALAGWDNDAPWYPERAIINLVRPVSQSELDAGESAAAVESLELSTILGTPVATDVDTLPTNGTVTSVESIEAIAWHDNPSFTLTPGVDYTVSGNDVTFLTSPENTQYLIVYYTVEIEINGSGISGIGDTLIKAMNPAHVIYEALTNKKWGRGLPSSKLDNTSFTRSADTLYGENHGYCRRWARRDEIQSFVQSVLDQIGGVLFENRTTGLLHLKLIRADYLPENAPLFDTSTGVIAITDAPMPASPKMINEVRVQYRDPVTNNDRIVRVSNLAALQSAAGSFNVLSKEYPGCPTSEIATRLAKRDMRASAPGLRRFSITLDRRGSKLQPGSVIQIQDLVRNISTQFVRIAKIDFGTMGNGEVKVEAVSDVFSTPRNGFTTIGPPSWIRPNTRPCVSRHRFFELPYRSIYRALNAADFDYVEDTAAYFGLVIDKGTSLNVTTDIAVRDGAVEIEDWPSGDEHYCGYTPPP